MQLLAERTGRRRHEKIWVKQFLQTRVEKCNAQKEAQRQGEDGWDSARRLGWVLITNVHGGLSFHGGKGRRAWSERRAASIQDNLNLASVAFATAALLTGAGDALIDEHGHLRLVAGGVQPRDPGKAGAFGGG